jgi:hypothetical protein
LVYDDAKRALYFLKEKLKESTLRFSFRTSVHVHVNVQELEYNQLLNMIYTYFLIEEPLMTFCGKERKGNRFCLRLQDAEGILDTLVPLFRHKDYLGDIQEEKIRYSALNLAALNKFGSLEFRAMKGNLDVPKISTWMQALFNLREFAMSADNPREILGLFQNNTPAKFLELVLKDVTPSFVYPKMDRDMQQSLSLSLDLPYSYPLKKREVQPKKIIEAYKALDIRPIELLAAEALVPMNEHQRNRIFGEFAQRLDVPAAPPAPVVKRRRPIQVEE